MSKAGRRRTADYIVTVTATNFFKVHATSPERAKERALDQAVSRYGIDSNPKVTHVITVDGCESFNERVR